MRYACVLWLLVGGIVANTNPVATAGQVSRDPRPQAIFWPQSSDWPTPPTPVGLLYTPELLAILAAESPASVSPRIDHAIRQQTPIVVMWTIPPTGNSEPFPRPFSTVIIDARGDSFGFPSPGQGVRIEPLWVEQHADDLRRLDARTEFVEVGVMAGYPRSAFVPGRLVTIHRRLPRELGRGTGTQRFGLIQWNGVTPLTQ